MEHRVEGAGVALRAVARGAMRAPSVLLVHGLGAGADALAPAAEALAGQARVVAYDRRGYGGSGAPEPYAGTTAEEQGEDAAALLRALDLAPAVVAGDGFGALVALDLLHRHRPLVRGAVLVEPPLFAFVPAATQVLAEAQGRMSEALRRGGPPAAAVAWLGREVPREALRGFFADVAGLASLSLGRRELRALDVPVAVVSGPATPPHVRAAADAAATLLPRATRRTDGDLAAGVRAVLALAC